MIEKLEGKGLAAANVVYAELRFRPSDADDETYALIEDGELHALGRISRGDDGALEVGGFWTREDLRGKGIASRMVTHVLGMLPEDQVVWCLPFDHLVDFYRSFGMDLVPDEVAVPQSIEEKEEHCRAETCGGELSHTRLLVFRT